MIGEDSGLHILLKVHNGMREEELIKAAAKYSIKIYPVSTYYKADTAPENVVLLGFAILSEEEIEQAVQLLNIAWFRKSKNILIHERMFFIIYFHLRIRPYALRPNIVRYILMNVLVHRMF